VTSARWFDPAGYEHHIGRWSRLVAREFVAWMRVRPGSRWIDVGCGTGALTQAILDAATPVLVTGIDSSPELVEHARQHVFDERASFVLGDACGLPVRTRTYEAAVSGLALNVVDDSVAMAKELARVIGPGDVAGAYVWDFRGAMQLLRFFWDAAAVVAPEIRDRDPGVRYGAITNPETLFGIFTAAGLGELETRAIDVRAPMKSFDEYWAGLVADRGSDLARFVASLDAPRLHALRERVRASIPHDAFGGFELVLRAWAVRGVRVR
jgi:SAM-dependent methyltransferase